LLDGLAGVCSSDVLRSLNSQPLRPEHFPVRFTAHVRERPAQTASKLLEEQSQERERKMDSVTLIRVIAGVLFVIVLVVLIQRRRTRVK